jgi:hypothetical protein
MDEWTWRKEVNQARYDRVYTHDSKWAGLEVIHVERLSKIWPKMTDHVALHVVLRRVERPVVDGNANHADVGGDAKRTITSASSTGENAQRSDGLVDARQPKEDVLVLDIDRAVQRRMDQFHEVIKCCGDSN